MLYLFYVEFSYLDCNVILSLIRMRVQSYAAADIPLGHWKCIWFWYDSYCLSSDRGTYIYVYIFTLFCNFVL